MPDFVHRGEKDLIPVMPDRSDESVSRTGNIPKEHSSHLIVLELILLDDKGGVFV
jgi:hypothetical protein